MSPRLAAGLALACMTALATAGFLRLQQPEEGTVDLADKESVTSEIRAAEQRVPVQDIRAGTQPPRPQAVGAPGTGDDLDHANGSQTPRPSAETHPYRVSALDDGAEEGTTAPLSPDDRYEDTSREEDEASLPPRTSTTSPNRRTLAYNALPRAESIAATAVEDVIHITNQGDSIVVTRSNDSGTVTASAGTGSDRNGGGDDFSGYTQQQATEESWPTPDCPSRLPSGTTDAEAQLMASSYGCRYLHTCVTRNDGSGEVQCWWGFYQGPGGTG